MDASVLLTDLDMYMNLARADALARAVEDSNSERKRQNVTGYWKGYDSDGMGLVLYKGKIYRAKVMSSKVRPRDALVNLRRTPEANFVIW